MEEALYQKKSQILDHAAERHPDFGVVIASSMLVLEKVHTNDFDRDFTSIYSYHGLKQMAMYTINKDYPEQGLHRHYAIALYIIAFSTLDISLADAVTGAEKFGLAALETPGLCLGARDSGHKIIRPNFQR